MADDDENKILSTPGFATASIIFEQICNRVNGNNYVVWDRLEEKFLVRSDVWELFN